MADVSSLDRYRWTGHGVVIGKQDMPGQDVNFVLSMFGRKISDARNGYRSFIADGVSEGHRNDFVVKPSTQVQNAVDSRVLGSREFAEEILLQVPAEKIAVNRRQIADIIAEAAAAHGVPVRAISGNSRLENVVRARADACRLALEEGYSAAEVGRYLGISRHSVGRAARRASDRL